VFREYSSGMALWLFALAVASFALQAVDNSHILSMLSLSQVYAEAGAAKADAFQALALVVGCHNRHLADVVCGEDPKPAVISNPPDWRSSAVSSVSPWRCRD